MRTVVTATRMWTPQGEIADPLVVIEDGAITQIDSSAAASLPGGEVLDLATGDLKVTGVTLPAVEALLKTARDGAVRWQGPGIGTSSATPTSMIPGIDIAIWPMNNPGIVSIPLGFLLGVIGTFVGKDRSSELRYNELSVRSLTGAGADAHVGGVDRAPS